MSDDEPVLVLSAGRGVLAPQFSFPEPPKYAHMASWIPAGGTIHVAGMTISGGLVYLGNGRLKRSSGDPCFIDPSASVSTEGNFRIGEMDYWPSYTHITPTARRSYLEWLADGRSNPDADIGYVFLFFYGLERRAIVDAANDPEAQVDWPVIAAELRRLLSIYGEKSASFRDCASELLDVITVRREPKLYLKPLPLLTRTYHELPLQLRVTLGQAVADGVPIPAHLASAWIRFDPNYFPRTPATRCPDEFNKMFASRYERIFGAGMVVPRNKTKLKYIYRPASIGDAYLGGVELTFGDFPDVCALTKPVGDLRHIAEIVTTALDPYSRYLGRNPDGRDNLGGILLLPMDMWPTATRKALIQFSSEVGNAPVVLAFQDLLTRLGANETFNREGTLALVKVLDELKVGFEPDVLGGGKLPKPDDHVVLFALPGPEEVRATAAFQIAALTLQLASTVAAANGGGNDVEFAHLRDQIKAWVHLTPAHRARLNALLQLLVAAPVSLTSLKKRLEVLDVAAKESIASFMSVLAQADGAVSAKEIKALEKIYKVLGFDSKKVFSDLNAAGTAAHSSAPKSAASTAGGFKLDRARIAALQQDTAKVSALLANIFAEDGDQAPAVPVAEAVPEADEPQAVQAALLGLNEAHAAFALMLLTRNEWTRAELADVADDLELMLDGALERINEAAFDAHDMPFTEGEDPIEINTELREKIEA